MSLPSGVINQPSIVTSHPLVFGQVLGVAWRVLFVTLPLLLHVAAQVPGVALRYRCSDLRRQINEQRLERRNLLAERERLLAPDLLRAEASRLGLIPPAPAERPVVLRRAGGNGSGR